LSRIPVLHVMRPAEGGMRKHVMTLVKNLDPELFQPMVACPGQAALDRNFSVRGVQVFPIDIPAGFNPVQDFRALKELCGIIRRARPLVVHTHGARADILGRAAASLTGVPVVVNTVHNFVYESRVPGWQKKLYSLYRRTTGRFTDHFITVSRALAGELASKDGVPQEKITTIYNGIDLSSLNFILDCRTKKAQLGLDPYAPVVGTAGRLIPTKGVDLFLEAAVEVKKAHPGTRFLVVGDGPERSRLKKLAVDLGLGWDIMFTGFRRDFPGILPLINVFVIPSISEGQSIVTLEAMASRRPIVAFETGGIPELITHNKTGILVPVISSSYLARGVIKLLEHPAWAERLGNNARQEVEQRFQEKTMVEMTGEVYRQCLRRKGILMEPAPKRDLRTGA